MGVSRKGPAGRQGKGVSLPQLPVKSVRFADSARPQVVGVRTTSAPQRNADRTRPILYQSPLGVASCVVRPNPRSVPGVAGNATVTRHNAYVTSTLTPPGDRPRNYRADDRPGNADCEDYNRSPVEPSQEDSEYGSDPPPELIFEDVDQEEAEDSDDDIPPYYRKRVPSPLPQGYFRDQRSHQVFTRERYQPENGVNECEVRTYEVQPKTPPDTSRIYSFHPGRFTPVNNLADFENYKKSRRKARSTTPSEQNSPVPLSPDTTATYPHEPELNSQASPIDTFPRRDCANNMAAVAVPSGVARLQERNDLAQLNDRLAHYITEVKHLREQANRVDSTAFLESIKILEDGLYNLKNLYEQELDKARRHADDLSREKNHYAMQVSKHQNGLQELENRLADELNKNRKAQDDMNILHRSVAEKERQLEEIRHEVKEPLEELERLRRQYTDLLRENTELKRKTEAENYQRNEAEDKSDQMKQQMDFMDTVHKQEALDLNNRLAVAQENILTLEQRVRDLTRPDNLVEDLVQRVRNSADHEMTMFREESEELFQRTVTALKARIDEDTRKVEDLTSHNVQLTSEAGEMLSQIRALEGQVGSLEHQRKSLEDILYNERNHARAHITGLERKLQDLSDMLILKLRELNAARDAQVPLKSEIEALRVLLEEEERRLRSLPEISSAPGAPRPLHPLTSAAPVAAPLTAAAYAAGVNIGNPTSTGRLAPTQPLAPPLGPVRARSAPSTTPKLNLIPSDRGQGNNYFDQMFNDLKRDVIKSRQAFAANQSPTSGSGSSPFERPGNPEPGRAAPAERSPSSTTHDYNTSTSSYTSVHSESLPESAIGATGPIRILEVHPDGKYVRLVNTATTKDEEFGNFLLQQNVGGQPVAVYRFPPRLRFPAGNTVTIWSGSNDPMTHQPPTDFVFKEQTKWGTGPECTTILCKPSGQAVAWTTAAHRFSRDAFDQLSLNTTRDNTGKLDMKTQEELNELSPEVNGPRSEAVYLRREKEQPPSLSAQKHPHGVSPPSASHPNAAPSRPMTYGNDNSSLSRQSRSQTNKPDPVPGAPYAGAAGQRMGSAALRTYNNTIKGNGHITNKKEVSAPGETTSRPPSSFQKPRDRFAAGLDQISSQHHEDFLPPMPRPPLFSAW